MLEECVYLQLYSRAAAPCRDYYGLTITDQQVILNIWNISYGPHVYPKRHKCYLREFGEDSFMSSEIERVFGKHVITYCLNLTQNFNSLQCVPTKIFLFILKYLATNDILKLSQTSKIFFELCNREDAWKLIFRNRTKKMPVTIEEIEGAATNGWRNVLKNKLLIYEHRMASLHLKPESIKKTKVTQNNIKIKNNTRIDNTKNNKINLTKSVSDHFDFIQNNVLSAVVKEKNINELNYLNSNNKNNKNHKKLNPQKTVTFKSAFTDKLQLFK